MPDRITSTADIVAGDQIQARGVGGGSAPAGLVMQVNGTFYFEANTTPANFDVRIWDDADDSWGAWATQTVTPADSNTYYVFTGISGYAAGDQVQARGVGGGSAPTGLTLTNDGRFYFTSGNAPADFDVRYWSLATSAWSNWSTQGMDPPSLKPSNRRGGRMIGMVMSVGALMARFRKGGAADTTDDLLLENGDFLLLENGDKILLE